MLQKLYHAMIAFDRGDARRIQHFIKVHSLARQIGLGEGLTGDALMTLEAAAIVHDIGIHAAEEKYGYNNGKLQEEFGAPLAERLLRELGFPDEITARVAYLVGHHHTYAEIDGLDYRILVEADFLVNLYEDGADEQTIRTAYDRMFKTETGRALCRDMFGID